MEGKFVDGVGGWDVGEFDARFCATAWFMDE